VNFWKGGRVQGESPNSLGFKLPRMMIFQETPLLTSLRLFISSKTAILLPLAFSSISLVGSKGLNFSVPFATELTVAKEDEVRGYINYLHYFITTMQNYREIRRASL